MAEVVVVNGCDGGVFEVLGEGVIEGAQEVVGQVTVMEGCRELFEK